MDTMIVLHNGKHVPLPVLGSEKPRDLGWYTDALQDILPCDTLVCVQRWALEQSEIYGTSIDYWYAVLVAVAANAVRMDHWDFLQKARSNPSFRMHLS